MQIDDVRYNPELCGFEALARFHEADMVVSYPVFLPAPVNAEFALIMRGLARKAREMHRAPQKGMVMRRPLAAAASPVSLGMRRLLHSLLGGITRREENPRCLTALTRAAGTATRGDRRNRRNGAPAP